MAGRTSPRCWASPFAGRRRGGELDGGVAPDRLLYHQGVIERCWPASGSRAPLPAVGGALPAPGQGGERVRQRRRRLPRPAAAGRGGALRREDRAVYAAELALACWRPRAGDSAVRGLVTFPPASQDLAVVVDVAWRPPGADLVRRAGGKLLREVSLFDVYRATRCRPASVARPAAGDALAGAHADRQGHRRRAPAGVLGALEGEYGATLRSGAEGREVGPGGDRSCAVATGPRPPVLKKTTEFHSLHNLSRLTNGPVCIQSSRGPYTARHDETGGHASFT